LKSDKQRKEEIYAVMKYAKKKLSEVIYCVNELFGCSPPKIDIIFGTQAVMKEYEPFKGITTSCFAIFQTGYPFILVEIHKYCKRENYFNINPSHLAVVKLGHEYAHYAHVWLHKPNGLYSYYEIVENLSRSKKKSERFQYLIGEARKEAVAYIAELEVAKRFNYRGDFEMLALYHTLMLGREAAREEYRCLTEQRTFHFEDVLENLWPYIVSLLAIYYEKGLKKMKPKAFRKWLQRNPYVVGRYEIRNVERIIQNIINDLRKGKD
jgi:hypothetical protein